MMSRRLLSVVFAAALLVAVPAASRAEAPERLRLATTTSTENSGLLAEILPAFEARCRCEVDVIAVGTGQALKLGEQGDVDVVLVHAPALEEAFVQAGHGVQRRTFMQNDFVVVGPAADPAGVRGGQDAAAALKTIHSAEASFVSRGDSSGTHLRELALWSKAGLEPSWGSYLSAGQGMGAVLVMASEKQAYTLSDRGTWLAFEAKADLQVLVEGDPALLNPYSVISVSPATHHWVEADLARRFGDWLCSAETQRRIGAFRIEGEALFVPLLLE